MSSAELWTLPATGANPLGCIDNPDFDPERFVVADTVARHAADSFFNAGELSLEFGIHFGVFKRALAEVRFTRNEKKVYLPWIAAVRDKRRAYQHALGSPQLSVAELVRLEGQDDPALHIRDTLERVRTGDHPGIEHDVNKMDKIRKAYELIINGIHNPNGLK